jgi:hypothetical protein
MGHPLMSRLWLLVLAGLALALPAQAQNFGNIKPNTVLGNPDPTASKPAVPMPFSSLTQSVTPAQYGAVCDGTTDARPGFQAAIDAAAADGLTVDARGLQRCLIDSADLNIPGNVQINCGAAAPGYQPNNAVTANANIILNSARTLKFTAASVAASGGRAGLEGCLIVRKGFSNPLTLRTAITEISTYAGVAITCLGTSDVTISGATLIGFATAIDSACDRTRLHDVNADATTCFYLHDTLDMLYGRGVHCWPFGTPSYVVQPQQTSTVTGAVNNGGLIKLTLGSVPTVPLVTGDKVFVQPVGGVPNASGKWTITVDDTTHITLQGSTFAGAFTTGGSVVLSAVWRSGKAFDFNNVGGGAQFAEATEYGWTTGVHLRGGTTGVKIDAWLDALSGADQTGVGVLAEDTSGVNYVSGINFANGIQYKMNSAGTAGNPAKLFINDFHVVTLQSNYLLASGIQVLRGSVYLGSGYVHWATSGVVPVYVANAATEFIAGSDIAWGSNQSVVSFESAAACPKAKLGGQVGPCAWTPAYAGTAGTPSNTYTAQVGSYTIAGTMFNAAFKVSTSAIGGMTGALRVSGFPQTAANDVSCSIGQITGMTLPAGQSQFIGQMNAGNNYMGVGGIGSNTLYADLNAASFSVGTSLIEGRCVGSYQATP